MKVLLQVKMQLSSLPPPFHPSSYTPNLSAPPPPFFIVPAAAAAKKEKKKRQSTSSRGWSFDQLMLVWDHAFDLCCKDAGRALLVRDIAKLGLAAHGRGCVLVCESVHTKPRGAAAGFTSKPRKSSTETPAYVSQQWSAFYVPRAFIMDPRKAPDDALDVANASPRIRVTANATGVGNDPARTSHITDSASNEMIKALDTSSVTTSTGLGNLDSDMPSIPGYSEANNAMHGNEVYRVVTNAQYPETSGDPVHLVTQSSLYSAMKGTDRTRLLSLTANFDFSRDNNREKVDMIDVKTVDAGGEEPYNPEEEELVMMLSIVVDGRQVVGADVLKAYLDSSDLDHAGESSLWKLRLRNSLLLDKSLQ